MDSPESEGKVLTVTKTPKRLQQNVILKPEEHAKLQEIMQKTGKSAHDILCEALDYEDRTLTLHLGNPYDLEAPLSEPLHEHTQRSQRVRVLRGLHGYKDEDVDPRVITAVKAGRGFFRYNHGKAVDAVLSTGYTWDTLCEACKLYLLANVKLEEEEDDEDPASSLDYTAEKLDADRNEIYDFYRRIVKIGDNGFDLRTS